MVEKKHCSNFILIWMRLRMLHGKMFGLHMSLDVYSRYTSFGQSIYQLWLTSLPKTGFITRSSQIAGSFFEIRLVLFVQGDL